MNHAAALSTGPYTHLDHLGVLATLFEIPLIVTDAHCYALAKEFYPQAKIRFMQPVELSLDFLAQNFDQLFVCGKYVCLELQPFFELFYKKRMRFILCPHGNSDKGVTDTAPPPQDIMLIYGEQMRQLLEKTGALAKAQASVTTGNYRFPFYSKNKEFYDRLAQERIFSRLDKNKETILYAPTWSNAENPTCFYEACQRLVEELAPFYNLLIKLHPFLEEQQPAHLVHLQEKYASYANVLFITDFPAIYPLLAKSSLYIGDFSSVGYDFLAFDRPLYFYNPARQSTYLPLIHQAGLTMEGDLRRFLQETEDQKSPARQDVYAHAFGQERSPRDIKEELSSLFGPARGQNSEV